MFKTSTYIKNALSNLYFEDKTEETKKQILLLEECLEIEAKKKDSLKPLQDKKGV